MTKQQIGDASSMLHRPGESFLNSPLKIARLKMTPRTALLVIGAIFAIALIVRAVIERRRLAEPLDQFSERIVKAFDDQNASVLYQSAANVEIEKLQLTPAKVQSLLDWSHLLLAGYKPVHAPKIEQGQRGYFAIATEIWKSQEGTESPFLFASVKTPTGPKVFLTSSIVLPAIYAKYGPLHQDKAESLRFWIAAKEGLVKEQGRLEAMGIKGIVNNADGYKMISWRRYLNFIDGAISRQTAQLERTHRELSGANGAR